MTQQENNKKIIAKAEFEAQVNAMSHYERYHEFQARGLSPSGIVTDIDSREFTVMIPATPAEVKKAIVEDMMKSSKKEMNLLASLVVIIRERQKHSG